MKPVRVALIPAYQPDELLCDLLHELALRDFFLIVVNDGSGAEYEPIFEEASRSAVILTHHENRGKGAALRTGLQYLKDNFPFHYTVVTMDADGQHRICDAEHICRAAEEHPDALILGCRDFKGKVPFRSRFGNRMTSILFKLTSGRYVSDTQTGLRAFSDALTPVMLSISGDRYEYEMNVLSHFARAKMPMHEVRIRTIYIDDNKGSHFHPLRDSFRIYKELLKFSLSSFSCFLLDFLLYCVILGVSGSETTANLLARVVSSIANYSINRWLVFRDDQTLMKTASQYFALVVFIILCNTALLWLFVNVCHMDPYVGKILTEVILFLLSWIVQHSFIFRRKKGSA